MQQRQTLQQGPHLKPDSRRARMPCIAACCTAHAPGAASAEAPAAGGGAMSPSVLRSAWMEAMGDSCRKGHGGGAGEVGQQAKSFTF